MALTADELTRLQEEQKSQRLADSIMEYSMPDWMLDKVKVALHIPDEDFEALQQQEKKKKIKEWLLQQTKDDLQKIESAFSEGSPTSLFPGIGKQKGITAILSQLMQVFSSLLDPDNGIIGKLATGMKGLQKKFKQPGDNLDEDEMTDELSMDSEYGSLYLESIDGVSKEAAKSINTSLRRALREANPDKRKAGVSKAMLRMAKYFKDTGETTKAGELVDAVCHDELEQPPQKFEEQGAELVTAIASGNLGQKFASFGEFQRAFPHIIPTVDPGEPTADHEGNFSVDDLSAKIKYQMLAAIQDKLGTGPASREQLIEAALTAKYQYLQQIVNNDANAALKTFVQQQIEGLGFHSKFQNLKDIIGHDEIMDDAQASDAELNFLRVRESLQNAGQLLGALGGESAKGSFLDVKQQFLSKLSEIEQVSDETPKEVLTGLSTKVKSPLTWMSFTKDISLRQQAAAHEKISNVRRICRESFNSINILQNEINSLQAGNPNRDQLTEVLNSMKSHLRSIHNPLPTDHIDSSLSEAGLDLSLGEGLAKDLDDNPFGDNAELHLQQIEHLGKVIQEAFQATRPSTRATPAVSPS